MESASAPVICAGGVVKDAAGRLLLVRRGHPPQEGRWSLPGGRVEAGESDQQAVARELAEETGLAVSVGECCGSVDLGGYLVSDYRCTVTGGTLRAGDDATDVGWTDAAAFERMAATGQLTDGLAATLRSWGVSPG